MDSERQLLRHTLATLAYRASKPLRDAPESFCKYRPAEGSRSAVEILAHMGDLFDWALSMAAGNPTWNNSHPQEWPQEVERFFRTLTAFDAFLASDAPLHAPLERLMQGPVADALTHTGQLAMLRRLAGSAARGENFYVADVSIGRVGSAQSAPVKPF